MDADRREPLILLTAVFLIAICSLVYELLAGAVSSYLLGSSILQFSLVIGIFLTAMGIGSFFSQFIRQDLMARFILIELAIGLLGGASAFLLFFAFAWSEAYLAVLIGVTGGIGILSGLEIPLILRILKARNASLRLSVANVMAADYLGALAASLAFPFLLVPHLGLMRAAFALGLLNIAVAGLCLHVFRDRVGRRVRFLRSAAVGAALCVTLGLVFSGTLIRFNEDRLYPDEILLTRQTPYQRIVVTRWRDDTRLFLNGNLQFSTRDEYRYHESLVHPALSLAAAPQRILILGGGDGMAVRECLKYPAVRRIDLVDLDPGVTDLFRDALRDPRLRIENRDAMAYLEQTDRVYDAILIDLPDPSVLDLGKLYTRFFYSLVHRRLAPGGVIAVQAASPFFAPDAFWCIVHTLDAVPVPQAGADATLHVLPYHANVPSFGEWGFVLAARQPLSPAAIRLQAPTRFLTAETLPALFAFPADMRKRPTEINRLDNQILVQYYTRNYSEFYQ